jgi:hypothetical protein
MTSVFPHTHWATFVHCSISAVLANIRHFTRYTVERNIPRPKPIHTTPHIVNRSLRTEGIRINKRIILLTYISGSISSDDKRLSTYTQLNYTRLSTDFSLIWGAYIANRPISSLHSLCLRYVEIVSIAPRRCLQMCANYLRLGSKIMAFGKIRRTSSSKKGTGD